MAGERVMMAALVPVGFQVLTLNSTAGALSLNSTCRKGSVLDVSIETNSVRYRADGTSPTLTTGVILSKDVTYRLDGFNGTSIFKMIRTTGVSKVSVMSYRYVGDGR